MLRRSRELPGWGLLVVVSSLWVCFLVADTADPLAASSEYGQASRAEESLPELPPSDRQAIQTVLEKQVAAWNEGSVTQFMDGYWHSPKLTFASGGNLTRGWQETHDRYQKRYNTPEKMGKLRFDHLEYQAVGKDAVLVLGQWHLQPVDGDLMEGNFTLIVCRFESGWKVVHDHTSLTPDNKE